MKVLIGVLAHQLSSEVVKGIYSQEWSDPAGFDVLTCWGDDIRPGEDRFQAITRKYGALQRTFLSGAWDALLCVEQDMFIPPDALTRLAGLLDEGADVAYALYVWRYSNQHWWSAHPHLAEVDGEINFWSLTHAPDEARRCYGQPVIVDGLGMGCTLISRRALVRIPFRQRPMAYNHCNDTAFALDCKDEGFTQVAHLGVVCGHGMSDGRIVWPDIDAPDLYRIQEAP